MGYGNFVINSQSPGRFFSSEDYNERQNYRLITIEEKIKSRLVLSTLV